MANVMLSEKEFFLLQNQDFILTKNSIIAKVQTCFGEICTAYQSTVSLLPTEVSAVSPKISKGEHYKGLPWIMLDYPRYFTKEHVMAVRSFCWWGKYYSISLHIKGKYLQQYAPQVQQHLSNEWKINTSQEWEHDMDAPCYKNNIHQSCTSELQVLRIAKKIPLQQLAIVEERFKEAFTEIITALVTQTVK